MAENTADERSEGERQHFSAEQSKKLKRQVVSDETMNTKTFLKKLTAKSNCSLIFRRGKRTAKDH